MGELTYQGWAPHPTHTGGGGGTHLPGVGPPSPHAQGGEGELTYQGWPPHPPTHKGGRGNSPTRGEPPTLHTQGREVRRVASVHGVSPAMREGTGAHFPGLLCSSSTELTKQLLSLPAPVRVADATA